MRTLERLFGLSERRTTVGTELMGGLATFMMMAFLVYFALPWLRPLFAV